MAENRNMLLGTLAIILGLLVVAFPLISVFTASIIAGLGIFFLGIWVILQSLENAHKGMTKSVVLLIIGILSIIVGMGLIGRIVSFGILVTIGFYIAGLLLILSGLVSVFSVGNKTKGSRAMGIFLGLLVMILGFYAWNPLYLALLIGFGLIIFGFSKLIETTRVETEAVA